MRRIRFIALAVALAMPVHLLAQDRYVPVEERLSAEEMRATGLDQLSAEQLRLLNRLLGAEQAAIVSAIREQAAPSLSAPERTRIESRIQGRFRGWSTGTVLTLENGQQWRVVDGQLDARATDSPRVVLRPGVISGWYLQVDGHVQSATVRRVK